MRAPVDTLIDAAIAAVEQSGAIDARSRLGVVSDVNSDGTISASVGDSTLTSIRVLSGYTVPTVGDTVSILRGTGGWVCVGSLATSSPEWQTPSLNSPWSAYGSGYRAPRYRRVGKMVEIQGVISSGSTSVSGSPVVFTLPASYRPTASLVFAVPRQGGTARQLTVMAGGDVNFQSLESGAVNYISIGCSYSVD